MAETFTATALLGSKKLVKAATKKSKDLRVKPIPDFTEKLKAIRKLEKERKRHGGSGAPTASGSLSTIRDQLVKRDLIPSAPDLADVPTFRELTAVSEFWGEGADLVLDGAGSASGNWAVHVTTGIPLTALPKALPGGLQNGDKALARLRGENIPEAPELAGFARLVASYLWGAATWETEKKSRNPKQMVGLLARNNFATMFGMIRPAARDCIAQRPELWLAAWADEFGDALGRPFLKKPAIGLETSYTRAEWLKSMIGTVSGGTHHPGTDPAAEDQALDSMGKWSQVDADATGTPIPIFEDRLFENWMAGEWAKRGVEHFKRNLARLEG